MSLFIDLNNVGMTESFVMRMLLLEPFMSTDGRFIRNPTLSDISGQAASFGQLRGKLRMVTGEVVPFGVERAMLMAFDSPVGRRLGLTDFQRQQRVRELRQLKAEVGLDPFIEHDWKRWQLIEIGWEI